MNADRPTGASPTPWHTRFAWLIAFLATLVAAVSLVLFVTARKEGSETVPSTTTHPAVSTTSTASTTSTTATTSPAPPDSAIAVWPFAASTNRYSDPVAAARSFAVDFVGFTAPVVGPFRAGDARSGEVDVRPKTGGPVTTIIVRRLGADDTWWVLGAATANIVLREPAALSSIVSPVRLRGSSSAFEATVNTQVREDGDRKPLGSGFVMGGSGIALGPFDGTLAFSAPTAASGAVMLYTISSETGHVSEATVVRVHFGAP